VNLGNRERCNLEKTDSEYQRKTKQTLKMHILHQNTNIERSPSHKRDTSRKQEMNSKSRVRNRVYIIEFELEYHMIIIIEIAHKVRTIIHITKYSKLG